MRQRATAMHLLHQDHGPPAVAQMLLVTVQAIYHWYHRFVQAGIEGLANRPKGRPKAKADAAYRQQLEQTLASEPSELSYDFAIWTVERLRDHLVRSTGKHLRISRLRQILRGQQYVYRRPKHDLTSLQDGEAEAAAQAQLKELKKAQQTTISHSSLDETTLRLHPPLRACWMKRGEQKRLAGSTTLASSLCRLQLWQRYRYLV